MDLVIACYGGGLGDLEESHELTLCIPPSGSTRLSPAKKKVVLVCSPEVLTPSLAVTENAAREAGFELLRHLSARCRAENKHDGTRLVHPPEMATDVAATAGRFTTSHRKAPPWLPADAEDVDAGVDFIVGVGR